MVWMQHTINSVHQGQKVRHKVNCHSKPSSLRHAKVEAFLLASVSYCIKCSNWWESVKYKKGFSIIPVRKGISSIYRTVVVLVDTAWLFLKKRNKNLDNDSKQSGVAVWVLIINKSRDVRQQKFRDSFFSVVICMKKPIAKLYLKLYRKKKIIKKKSSRTL